MFLSGKVLQPRGPQSGMLMDFGSISMIVKPLIEEKLDHHYLNETTGLENPTSEQLAHWVYISLKPMLPQLVAVEIDETCTSSGRYDTLHHALA